MTSNPLKKVLNILRNLKEDAAAAPTNSMEGGRIGGSVEAGDDAPVNKKKKKRKPTPLGRYRTRVNWR